MGMLTTVKTHNVEKAVKRGQGETNARLDVLIDEQQRTNELLEALLVALKGSVLTSR